MSTREKIAVEVALDVGIEAAWNAFVSPQAIVRWNSAGGGWRCPRAVNDLRVGGTFSYRMESGDGSAGFDFWGTYTEIVPLALIAYTLGDDRRVTVRFSAENGRTRVVERFEAESVNPLELQRNGWQAILDNYKRVAEEKAIS